MKVDRSKSEAVFEQVAGEIRRAILDGEAKPGERLPPAKDLAAELCVNTNTVLRALRVLREEGLLVRRLGLRVADGSEPAEQDLLGSPGHHGRLSISRSTSSRR